MPKTQSPNTADQEFDSNQRLRENGDTHKRPDTDTCEQFVEQGTARILRISPTDSGAGLREIDTDSFVFGRDKGCDIFVADTSASRQHARLVKYGENWIIVDMGSTNGTFVNDHPVQIQQLESGDCIKIGRWKYKFFAAGDVEADYHNSVYEMMTKDQLTGAWNRQYLLDVLEREISRHRRAKQPIALLIIELDRLSQINSQHGQMVGDEVLAEFGQRMTSSVRASEVFARYEGNRFAFVLINTNRDELRGAVKRFQNLVATPFQTSDGALECSTNFGYAVGKPGSKLGCEKLIAAASKSLLKTQEKVKERKRSATFKSSES